MKDAQVLTIFITKRYALVIITLQNRTANFTVSSNPHSHISMVILTITEIYVRGWTGTLNQVSISPAKAN